MQTESYWRSVAKTFSWRICGTLATSGFVYIVTGKLSLALIAGGLDATLKVVLYYIHERIWNSLSFGRHEFKPVVVWFTGLSGSGKTTLALKIIDHLHKLNLKVEHLDGDTIRNIFPNTGFSREERNKHIERIGHLASRLEHNGICVIASFISPYEESRQFVRNICHNYVEVYLSTSLEDCERRDPKGLYKRARSNELKNFTGISDPYEPSRTAELVIDTSKVTVDEASQEILNFISKYSLTKQPVKSHPSFSRSLTNEVT